MNGAHRLQHPRDVRFVFVALAWPLAGCGTDEVVFPVSAGFDMSADARVRPADPGSGPEVTPSGVDAAGEPGLDAPEIAPPPPDPIDPPPADAGAELDAACSEPAHAPYAGACTALALVPVRVTASAQVAGRAPASALDHDTCTSWSAGASPPQWMELELCTGMRCPAMPRIARLGVYLDPDLGSPLTIELQGATAAGRLNSAFHTMASASLTSRTGYDEMTVNLDAQPVMRVLVNSGPGAPVVLREVVFLGCP